MFNKNTVWTEKYRPIESKDVCGCDEVYHKILYTTDTPCNILIYGPPGTGKTTAVRSVLRNINSESIFFFDMSLKSADTCKQMTRALTNFVSKQTNKKHKLIVVDEIDCMRVIDQKIFKSFLSEKVCADYNYSISIIFMCNNIKKVSDFIVRKCDLIQFKPLKFENVKSYLKNICENEHLSYDIETLELIFNKSKNDLRKTITTLQYMYLLCNDIQFENYNKIISSVDIDEKYIDYILNLEIKEAVNSVFYEGLSTLNFIIKLFHYHKNRGKMTFEYVKILGKASNNALKSNNVWFILYQVIKNSPIFCSKCHSA